MSITLSNSFLPTSGHGRQSTRRLIINTMVSGREYADAANSRTWSDRTVDKVVTEVDQTSRKGSHIKSAGQCVGGGKLTIASFKTSRLTAKRALSVQASYSDGERASSGVFIGGFVLGGIIIGALGAVYAPQISKALAKADKKIPALIYGEEKALEMTRKKLAATIDSLNSDIDDISAHLRAEVSPNGVSVDSDEIEA